MIGVKITAGGFDKAVFESVIDTLAGGVTVDPSGINYTDDIIPAGTLISKKDVNGIAYPVTISNPGPSATFDRDPAGFSYSSVKVEDNTLVGLVIEGVVRADALSADAKSSAAAIMAKLPKITIV